MKSVEVNDYENKLSLQRTNQPDNCRNRSNILRIGMTLKILKISIFFNIDVVHPTAKSHNVRNHIHSIVCCLPESHHTLEHRTDCSDLATGSFRHVCPIDLFHPLVAFTSPNAMLKHKSKFVRPSIFACVVSAQTHTHTSTFIMLNIKRLLCVCACWQNQSLWPKTDAINLIGLTQHTQQTTTIKYTFVGVHITVCTQPSRVVLASISHLPERMRLADSS